VNNQFKPKVLIVHNYYQVPGGEDTVVVNEKKLLEDNRHEVILYRRDNSELKNFNKLQKICLPFTTVFSLRTYREVKKIIKEKKIDIVHVHNTLNLISPSVYYAAFSSKVPVVQTIHNFRLLCPGATFYRDGAICEDCVSNGVKHAVKHRCYRGSLAQTLACVITLSIHRLLGTYKKLNYICLTEFNKQKLLELNSGGKKRIDENKVFVKPNFVNMDREVIPFEKRKNQFVFAGRLDKLKGINLLLEAWKEINDSDLIICGTGPEEEWCRQYIEENGLTNVKMMGFVPNAQAMDIIAQSKALILPTQWYEGFPMTIVESFACGTPVIGSDIGNVGSLIEDGVTGLKFKFNSVVGLRGAVGNIQDLTLGCRKMFRNHYSSYINYKDIIDIYEECRD